MDGSNWVHRILQTTVSKKTGKLHFKLYSCAISERQGAMIAGIEKALNSSLPFGRATPRILFALSKCSFTFFWFSGKTTCPAGR